MPRTKNSPQTCELRQRLLHAAGEVFAEHGYRGATTRQITERASVNIAAVNYHFRDKAELYVCALREAHSTAASHSSLAAAGTPRERLRNFLASLLTYLLDPGRPAWQNRLLAREISEPSSALDELIEGGMRERSERLLALLRELAGTDLPRETLSWLACSMMGQCLHFAQNRPVIERLHPLLTGYHERIDVLTDRITDFVVPAVQAAARKARAAANANP